MLCIFIKNTILFLLIDFSLFHTESSYHLVIQQRWLLFSGIWCCRGSSLAGTMNFAFHIALSSTCYLCLLGHNSLCGFIYEADFWLSCGSHWIWGSQHHDMSWVFLFHLSLTETIWWSPDTLFLAPVRCIPISHVFTLPPCSDALTADGVYRFYVRPISMCSVKSWSEGGCGIKGSGFSVTSSSDDCPWTVGQNQDIITTARDSLPTRMLRDTTGPVTIAECPLQHLYLSLTSPQPTRLYL